MGSAPYEIRVRGRLGPGITGRFGFEAEAEAGQTVLRGEIGTQGELHALLEQVEAFGLELIEIRRVDSPGDT